MDEPRVRRTPSWPRSWANFSLLQLYSNTNAWDNLHRLGRPNTLLSLRFTAPGDVHYTAEGSARLAAQVAAHILDAL